MKRILISLLISLSSLPISWCQDSGNDENVIYEYKKYESFDLGSLEIKGDIHAPGDLTVEERKRKVFYQNLFERESFNKETKEDIRDIR